MRPASALGSAGQWCGNEKELELIFVSGDEYLTAVPIKLAPMFEIGDVETLFKIDSGRRTTEETYDVTKDGKRFLVQRLLAGPMASPITVDTNWTARLKALLRDRIGF